MKKLILLLICISMIQCARHSDKTVIVWHSMRPSGVKILREELKKFKQKYYPAWEFRELFYAPETARTNYIISALGGSGPALLWGANDNIGPLVELKVIQPIETYVTQTFLDSFLVSPLPANILFNDHVYQIADRIGNHLCLVYNKKLVPEPPETIQELKEIGKKLTLDLDGDGKPDQYALAWNYTEPFFAVPFIGGYGGEIINAQNQPTLNTPATIKAARLIYDLANKDKIIPIECDYEIANALFKDGYAAMIINGPWSWGTYLENKIDIGITRIPLVDETNIWPTPMISPLGYSLNINLKGEKLKVTIELLKYLTSTEVELRFTKAMKTIPSRKDAFINPAVQNDELIANSIYQMEVGKIMPVVTELRWIWDAMRPAYQGIFTGKNSPEDAAREMQVLAEKLIRENRE